MHPGMARCEKYGPNANVALHTPASNTPPSPSVIRPLESVRARKVGESDESLIGESVTSTPGAG